jgi:hypothetical protein
VGGESTTYWGEKNAYNTLVRSLDMRRSFKTLWHRREDNMKIYLVYFSSGGALGIPRFRLFILRVYMNDLPSTFHLDIRENSRFEYLHHSPSSRRRR